MKTPRPVSPIDVDTRIVALWESRSRKATLIARAQPGTDCAAIAGELDAVDVELRELNAVHDAQGWSRFWLVPGGHIHSSGCSTCSPTTRLVLVAELSGTNLETAVNTLGPLLCTVCFPDAPVEWRAGPVVSPDRCGSSLTYRFDRDGGWPARGTRVCCLDCGALVGLTSGRKLRTHDRGPGPVLTANQVRTVLAERLERGFAATSRVTGEALVAESVELVGMVDGLWQMRVRWAGGRQSTRPVPAGWLDGVAGAGL